LAEAKFGVLARIRREPDGKFEHGRFECHARERRIRVQQRCHDPNAGGRLLQDLQPLAGNLSGLGVKTDNAE
jgi:hypothetical protein